MNKIKLPEKIKIGYQDYVFQEWGKNLASSNEAYGEFFQKEKAIGLSKTDTGISHANTLLHELLHGVMFQWNTNLSEKDEEKTCSTIANGLTTIMRDNPWFLDYLKQNIKEG
tara:strand:- start:273 stop:608 length:336 start_codon:yes stop_codon:yes gene_type:complete